MSATRYALPASLDETVSLLASDPQSRPVAGGHSMLLPKNRKGIAGALLVDLRKLQELVGIQIQPDGRLRVGAMTTIGVIGNDEVLRDRFPALAEAAELVGDVQVRNRATLGGSLAAAEPEADLPAVMLALDAQFVLNGPRDSRTIPADQFFTGPQQTALRHDEILTSALLTPLPSRSGMAYEKFKHPATLYALCGVAAAVTLGENGSITTVRIGATGALSYATRLRTVEAALLNKRSDDGALSSISTALQSPSSPKEWTFRDDFFASAEYRQHLLEVLTRRALKRALERAAA